MNLIDCYESLEPHFLVPEYATPEAYFAATGKVAPEFDPDKNIKNWFDPSQAASKARQVTYEAPALSDNGTWVYDENGVFLIDLAIYKREEALAVNIPPKDFNFTGHKRIDVSPRPLKPGFTTDFDITFDPTGLTKVARSKAKYAQYLAEQAKGSGVSSDFEKKVLADLTAIKASLGIV